MNGKLLGIALVGTAAVAGAALYYLQVYHFYRTVPEGDVTVGLVALDTQTVTKIDQRALRAIDAGSSPIRFRACFETALDPADMAGRFVAYDGAEPLTAPGWFDCFDAAEIGRALEAGTALAFLSEPQVATGVDRVVAVLDDGRGFAWTQIRPGFGD